MEKQTPPRPFFPWPHTAIAVIAALAGVIASRLVHLALA
jgi:hypothetical protein